MFPSLAPHAGTAPAYFLRDREVSTACGLMRLQRRKRKGWTCRTRNLLPSRKRGHGPRHHGYRLIPARARFRARPSALLSLKMVGLPGLEPGRAGSKPADMPISLEARFGAAPGARTPTVHLKRAAYCRSYSRSLEQEDSDALSFRRYQPRVLLLNYSCVLERDRELESLLPTWKEGVLPLTLVPQFSNQGRSADLSYHLAISVFKGARRVAA